MVDDYEPWRRFVCTTVLNQPELQVVGEISDGLEAVQQAERLRPDLILLDIGLPTLNGIEAARRIREVSPASKIIFVNDQRSVDVAEEALSTGAGGGYVVKSDAGTELATVSLEGGTPREIAEEITSADWTPDGSGLAIVRDSEKLEFPVGKVLFQSAGWLSHPRFSPDGKLLAFVDHPPATNSASLVICDLNGAARVIAKDFSSAESAAGLAWSAHGQEIWFSGMRGISALTVLAVSLDGKERVVEQGPGWLTVQDVASDGKLLFTRDDWRVGIKAVAPHTNDVHDLSWFDWSLMGAISSDGEMIAFSESGEALGQKGYTYVRGIGGTPAVRLGEGRPWSISPDKKWVITTAGDALPLAGQLVLLPTGPGESKRYPPMKDAILYPTFLPDGKHVLFIVDAADQPHTYSMELDTGQAKLVLPEGVAGWRVSPDGKYVVARSAVDHTRRIYDLAGGPSRPIEGLGDDETVVGFGDGPLPLYVAAYETFAVKLFRLDPVTGKRRFWQRLMPSDPAGLRLIADIYVAPKAESYAYSYYRVLSQLFIAEGLR